MDAKQLIESGSLELYVMGSLPAEEMKQIDELRKHNKEVNLEIFRIENALEEFAFAQARKPKPELKEEIAKRIGLGLELDLETEDVKSIIVHLRPVLRFAAAAGVALVVIFAATTGYFYSQYNSANNELASLRQQQSVLAQQTKFVTEENQNIKNQLAVVSNPANQQVVLKGLPISPEAKAVVYWNKTTGSAYINCAGMPEVAENEQFQLWAIVDGKPVDLGVLDKNCSISHMKDVTGAVAFAITLEPLGGKPTPTMEKMYVMGAV
ncbi:MAG TPA: anti-sigma factor [Chitinophagales bacterium]|nr:anti-sigma factor [Chitinophagales bacterium]